MGGVCVYLGVRSVWCAVVGFRSTISVNALCFKICQADWAPHPREPGRMPWPPTSRIRGSRCFQPRPHPTMWLGTGCVIALATRGLSSLMVPIAQLLHVELAHDLQSPGIPSHTHVRASGCNGAPGATSGAGWWDPRSAIGAMVQGGRPQNSGGPMWPASWHVVV